MDKMTVNCQLVICSNISTVVVTTIKKLKFSLLSISYAPCHKDVQEVKVQLQVLLILPLNGSELEKVRMQWRREEPLALKI
jgi:hypothetical protein